MEEYLAQKRYELCLQFISTKTWFFDFFSDKDFLNNFFENFKIALKTHQIHNFSALNSFIMSISICNYNYHMMWT